MTTFYEFGLSFAVTRAISDMGFEEATPIQLETIPKALQGIDIIGRAQTGTGKTAAFGIPIMEKIDVELHKIQAVVITPTRELAIQVAEELNKIGQFKRIRALPIYGGQQIDRQIKALKKKPQIIVGTPGRLMDHMRRRTIRFDDIKCVVLDEADEMLNMGFIEDIETILQEIPDERQTLLFSATMSESIRRLGEKFMKNPELISIKAKEMTVPNIEQHVLEVREKEKFDVLCRLMDIQLPELAIIFGRTKRRVDELYEALNKRGYSVEGIHGDLSQTKRTSVLKKFKAGDIEVLVATDVAARGLDISGVTHVYNFDIPQDPESYVHRVGRTGRAGKTGLATTFVTPREIDLLKKIEQVSKRRMIRKPIPTLAEAFEGQQRIAMERLLAVVGEGNTAAYKQLATDLLSDHDSVTLLSAALKMITKEPDTSPVRLTEEKPLWGPKPFKGKDKHHRGRKDGHNRKRGDRSGSREKRRGEGFASRKGKRKRQG